ncbi:MAG: tetratricopeptide repeat protein [Chitinophagaceae bacterium]
MAFITLHQFEAASQSFLTTAPAENRLKLLWRYCMDNSISDKDSTLTHQFLIVVANTADSLGDTQLQAYTQYFRMCYRILFSERYEQHFSPGDYQTAIAVLAKAKLWAQKKGFEDIMASCEHYTGQIYFRAERYGLAFEHLLKADKAFKEIGYDKVPAAAIYLYTLGLDYYQFEDYDKALDCFLASSSYPVYVSRIELNTLNAIGLIYARSKHWDKAASFYRKTIAKAEAEADKAWVGIGSGNLGNIFLSKGEHDSALYYHRINYIINTPKDAPEDAAKSALSMATVFVRNQQSDSAMLYIRSGQHLAETYIKDVTERMKFDKRLFAVMIDFYKMNGDYRSALFLSDSLSIIIDKLQQKLDTKLLNRAVEKVEVDGHITELALLESRKSLNQLQFYLLIATLLLIIVIVSLIFSRYRLLKDRQMQKAEKEKQLLSTEKLRAENELKDAEERLTGYLSTLKENTIQIENLDAELHHLKHTSNTSGLLAAAGNMERLVSSTILTDEDWRQFRTLFEQVHPGFLSHLKERFPDLSPGETRLLILTKLDLSSREMATTLGISIDAIRKARYRLRKRLNLDKDSSFETVVEGIN